MEDAGAATSAALPLICCIHYHEATSALPDEPIALSEQRQTKAKECAELWLTTTDKEPECKLSRQLLILTNKDSGQSKSLFAHYSCLCKFTNVSKIQRAAESKKRKASSNTPNTPEVSLAYDTHVISSVIIGLPIIPTMGLSVLLRRGDMCY